MCRVRDQKGGPKITGVGLGITGHRFQKAFQTVAIGF